MLYRPASVPQMKEWKERLRYSGTQMARVTGLKSSRRWREYVDENKPQGMPLANLFMGAAMTVLPAYYLAAVFDEMRRIGAVVDPDKSSDSLAPDGEPQP
ncbi:MAG: hypothetical protein RXR52_42860 [Paraburkholderia sp.]|uniref:hypothetical protein n=1 Tax=Burkholderiaceae TaxID=119060 RepID=UPI00148510B5|nr:hypothetical protein [Burkholderia sp. 4M9327F10]